MNELTLKYNSYKNMPLNIFYETKDILSADIDELDKLIKLIALLCGMNEEDLLDMPVTSLRAFNDKLNFLNYFEPDNIAKCKHITINNTKYDVLQDARKMNVAQYVDFQTYATKYNEKIEYALSTLIIPHGKNYNEGYEVEDVINDILYYMPCTTASGLLFFFLTKSKKYIRRTLTFLGLKMKMMNKMNLNCNEINTKIQELEILLRGLQL